MKEVTLQSGAKLKIDVAPFMDAKALYQAVLEELRTVEVDERSESQADLIKNLFCASFTSKKIDQALAKCMERALYNGLKITNETWEPVEARADYMLVCFEVAKENLAPFVKSLSAEFSAVFQTIIGDRQSRPQTTQS